MNTARTESRGTFLDVQGELQSGKTGELTPPERFADSALAKDILKKIAKTIADGTKELKMQRSPHLVLLNLEFYDERWLGIL